MSLGRIWRNCLFGLAVLVWGAVAPFESLAQGQRVALVIGNSRYEHVSQLPNTSNDSQDLADALERIGFDVTREADLQYRDMRLAIRDFAEAAADADVVVVYFAGHGMEIDNTNYLIPVNAELQSDRDVDLEAIRLDTIIGAISGGPGLKIVLAGRLPKQPVSDDNGTHVGNPIGGARLGSGGSQRGPCWLCGSQRHAGLGRRGPEQPLMHRPCCAISKNQDWNWERCSAKSATQSFELTDGYQEPFTYELSARARHFPGSRLCEG